MKNANLLDAQVCGYNTNGPMGNSGEPEMANDDINSIMDLSRFLSCSKYFKNQCDTDRMVTTASAFENANDLICLSHHVRCAINVIEKLEKDPSKKLVLFGHKWQGKSQLLYFLSELLQSLNEKVIYLDDSFSLEAGKLTSLRSRLSTSGKWWSSLKTKISKDGSGSRVHQLYDLFEECLNAQHASERSSEPSRWTCPAQEIFIEFLHAITTYVVNSGGRERVWLIIDEVTNNKDYLAAYLPSEQKMTAFHTIVTGSAGMGSFVAENHLKQWVYDFPRFSDDEMQKLADKLNKKLIARGSLSLYEAIRDVSTSQPKDWIQEQFAGVPGHLVEMCQYIADGYSVGKYAQVLTDRITDTLSSLSDYEVKMIKRSLAIGRNYIVLQNVDLCGSRPPSGFTLRCILRYILDKQPDLTNRENDLYLIDNALELDEILHSAKTKEYITQIKTDFGMDKSHNIHPSHRTKRTKKK